MSVSPVVRTGEFPTENPLCQRRKRAMTILKSGGLLSELRESVATDVAQETDADAATEAAPVCAGVVVPSAVDVQELCDEAIRELTDGAAPTPMDAPVVDGPSSSASPIDAREPPFPVRTQEVCEGAITRRVPRELPDGAVSTPIRGERMS
jgi:hypothetical protein